MWFDFTIHSFRHTSGYWTEIEGSLDHASLTKELAQEIETLWRDAAIQVASSSKIHKQPPWNLYCWYKVCLLSYFIIDTMVFMVSEWSISVINFNGYCRKHMPGAMSSKYQIAPLISWRICKDCLMQIIFQLRYLIFFPYCFHVTWMLCTFCLHN